MLIFSFYVAIPLSLKILVKFLRNSKKVSYFLEALPEASLPLANNASFTQCVRLFDSFLTRGKKVKKTA